MPTEKTIFKNGSWVTYYGPAAGSTTPANQAPIGDFTITQGSGADSYRANVDASKSYDPDGTIVNYNVDFGNGVNVDKDNPNFAGFYYTAAGVYNITLTLTDNKGLVSTPVTKQISVVAPPTGGTGGGSGSGSVSDWTQAKGSDYWSGDPTTGIPQSVLDNAVTFDSLYNQLSSAEKAGNVWQNVLNKLTSPKVILVTNQGLDLTVPDFMQAAAAYGSPAQYQALGWFRGSYLVGVIGTNGPTQFRIRQAPNSLTTNSGNWPNNQVNLLNSQTTKTTETYLGKLSYPNATNYVAGVTFEGTYPGATDKLQGISIGTPAANSVWQYFRIIGAGVATNSSPPKETFSLQEVRSQNLLVRHFEIDGRIQSGNVGPSNPTGYANPAMGARQAGMFGANAAQNITLEDGFLHDARESGLTFSYAGANYDSNGQPTSPTKDVTTRRMLMSNNANHSGTRDFGGINHEGVLGAVNHDHPSIHMDSFPGWNIGHITWTGAKTTNGVLRVTEPTWYESPSNAAGFFAVRSYGWYVAGASQGFKDLPTPIIIKNGVQLQPWVRTSNTTPPAGVSPTTHFVWNKG